MKLLFNALVLSTILFSIPTSWASGNSLMVEPQPVSVLHPRASENSTALLKEPSSKSAQQFGSASEYDPMHLIGPPGVPVDLSSRLGSKPPQQPKVAPEYEPMNLIGPPVDYHPR